MSIGITFEQIKSHEMTYPSKATCIPGHSVFQEFSPEAWLTHGVPLGDVMSAMRDNQRAQNVFKQYAADCFKEIEEMNIWLSVYDRAAAQSYIEVAGLWGAWLMRDILLSRVRTDATTRYKSAEIGRGVRDVVEKQLQKRFLALCKQA